MERIKPEPAGRSVFKFLALGAIFAILALSFYTTYTRSGRQTEESSSALRLSDGPHSVRDAVPSVVTETSPSSPADEPLPRIEAIPQPLDKEKNEAALQPGESSIPAETRPNGTLTMPAATDEDNDTIVGQFLADP